VEEVLKALAAPLFETGANPLHVSVCCDHLFVGIRPAGGCKHCKKVPVHVEMVSLDNAKDVLKLLITCPSL
jgi:hypothetical protein